MSEVTKKQIDAWKAEYGEVNHFKLGGDKECYLRMPDLKIMSYATMAGQSDIMAYNKAILTECWLAGDEEIKTHPGLFLSISQKLTDMIGIVEVELVKL
ncbi:hypothetical protein [Chryseobacterium sp.]|uniref:hypothetical protein n=1 Tax=Chryseobacterium sp. TaxID=1871047 RepID=UPI0028988848|nr:hypothetical protein [Chryseobacterium sp.]